MKIIRAAGFLLLFSSCGGKINKQQEEPLARVYDSYLYASDLKDIFSSTENKTDSGQVLNTYIRNWTRDEVLAHKAEQNLSAEEKDMEQELREYRKSLLVHRYINKLLLERLDTVTTEDQLREYFNNNKRNFELARNLVQLTFVKITEDNKALPDIRRLFLSPKIKDKKELARLCEKNAANTFLDDQTWLDFSEVQKELPIKQYDEEHFLRNNKFLEIKEGKYLYLVLIKAYRTKTGLSSFAFEKDNIRNILLNKRKLELLKSMEDDLLRKAAENKDIENYLK